MKTQVTLSLPPGNLRLGIIEARNVTVKPSSESYLDAIRHDIAAQLQEDFVYPDHLQKGIRGLLKSFGFHPSGRNRPASEFLFKDLQNRKEFNAINNVVDINNHLSLKYHLPISVLDLDKAGHSLCLRVGLDHEEYVFNREGQVLSLKKLLLVARQGNDLSPIGSPVKDSQATKVFTETKNIIGFVYTSANITSRENMQKMLNEFASLLKSEAQAEEVETEILDAL
jgi:DNA/RNA-binding domain of Phe-tRNA-synthetase-like protein